MQGKTSGLKLKLSRIKNVLGTKVALTILQILGFNKYYIVFAVLMIGLLV